MLRDYLLFICKFSLGKKKFLTDSISEEWNESFNRIISLFHYHVIHI